MPILASTLYDPAVLDVSKLTSALLAMTALDTTNLRLTFTVPANGSVLVRQQSCIVGATTYPRILMGILEGATVRLRQSPVGGLLNGIGSDFMPVEVAAVVSGLTPGALLTWDAAYGVEVVVAATHFDMGGPNDAVGNDATGGFAYEVWDTIGLLASKTYDPAGAASLSGVSLLAMTAMDTTNLRVTFKAPQSGKVYWRVRVPWLRGGSVFGQILLGVMEGATVRGRMAPQRGMPQTGGATNICVADGSGLVTGLTPGTSYTWDAAYAVQTVSAATIISYGGPNNTTTNDAWGAACFEVWEV